MAVLSWTGAAHAKTITVIGQNDINVDRQSIQDAIDSSPEKETKVKLKGIFQLDGTSIKANRSDLTLQGIQGATLLGLVDGNGLPQIPPVCSCSNRGIEVRNSSLGSIENIVIKGLILSGFTQAIRLSGPNAEEPVTAQVNNVVVKNNQIHNTNIGIFSFGGVSNVDAKHNTVTDAYLRGMEIIGDEVGSLSNTIVKNNIFKISASSNAPISFAFEIFGPASDILVKNNVIWGGLAAVALFSPGTNVTNVVLTKNLIRDGGSVGLDFLRAGGVLLGSEFAGLTSSGFVVENNSYENNQAIEFFVPPPGQPQPLVPRDVWLEVASDSNFVKEKLGTIVLDDGMNNTVILY